MIIGNRNSIAAYKGLSKNIDIAIDYILNLDSDIQPGKYEIDGDNVYASVIEKETKPISEIKYEAHKNYLDLQYIISGSEVMGYAPLDKCTEPTEYNSEKDIYFMKADGNLISCSKGDFYIVHPFDAHAPGFGYEKGNFKKIVVKIKL